MNNKYAFTLMEIMVVIIIIGILAAFAIPNYKNAIQKAHERDALVGLMTIYAGAQIKKSQDGDYPIGSIIDTDPINSLFGINIISNGLLYSYQNVGAPDGFAAYASYPTTSPIFRLKVSGQKIILKATVPSPITNPCCDTSIGLCLTNTLTAC